MHFTGSRGIHMRALASEGSEETSPEEVMAASSTTARSTRVEGRAERGARKMAGRARTRYNASTHAVPYRQRVGNARSGAGTRVPSPFAQLLPRRRRAAVITRRAP